MRYSRHLLSSIISNLLSECVVFLMKYPLLRSPTASSSSPQAGASSASNSAPAIADASPAPSSEGYGSDKAGYQWQKIREIVYNPHF